MTPPSVSIIMPAYNGAKHVGAALDSIACQTFTNWELIVVDDGSTDDTTARLALAPPDARRQVIQQPNAGPSAARNRGLAAAQGEYIAFLDVDDGWQADYLASMLAALHAAPQAVAAFCDWQYCDENGQLLPQSVRLSHHTADQLERDLQWRNSIMPSSLVARRQAIQQVGGFDVTLRVCEDWDLWLRLMRLGRFIAVPRVMTWYRAHMESKTEQIEVFEQGQLKFVAKHFGPLAGPVEQWPPARQRAAGFTYFTSALAYFRQNKAEAGERELRQAVACWPGLFELDEFYYELGCARQPRGQRGTAVGLDLKAGEALIRLALFDSAAPLAGRAAQRYWGHACLVLGRLARNTHKWSECRRYALRALPHAAGRDKLAAVRLLARSLAPTSARQSPLPAPDPHSLAQP